MSPETLQEHCCFHLIEPRQSHPLEIDSWNWLCFEKFLVIVQPTIARAPHRTIYAPVRKQERRGLRIIFGEVAAAQRWSECGLKATFNNNNSHRYTEPRFIVVLLLRECKEEKTCRLLRHRLSLGQKPGIISPVTSFRNKMGIYR